MRHRRNRNIIKKVVKKDIGIFLLLSVIVVEIITIAVLFKKEPAERKIQITSKGKIAIVIDDWGYNLKNINYLKSNEYPLTLSILPNLSYSKRIAEEARLHNKEVILHLPLEPHPYENIGLESATIKTDMTKTKIVRLLNAFIRSVPYIKGVSSHMGSKATEDEKLMALIFEELKNRKLYFLDSVTTDKTICKKVASILGLKFKQRNVFLDNRKDYAYIKHQLAELVDVAKNKASAIGIGHDEKITLQVLEEEMPRIEKEGFEFVFLSDLIN